MRSQARMLDASLARPEAYKLSAYFEALGGRLEIIADFGDLLLAFAEPGTGAA